MKINTGNWMSLVSNERRGLTAQILRFALGLASIPYSLTMRLRNLFYQYGLLRSHRVSVPVIVVGNLTVGGTGKTPAVEYIARFYRQRDRQLAILSRGYGAHASRNDEALVLESNLDDVPHLQGADRVDLAHRAIEELESDMLLLDDGFQHRRLARNLDIVLIDATNPWGFGWCFPRGMLREPIVGLKRAGIVLITRSDQVSHETLQRLRERVQSIAPQAIVAISRHAPVSIQNSSSELSLESIRGRQVMAFCGIGNPGSFFKSLQQLGCHVMETRTFPDHHHYVRSDVLTLETLAAQTPNDCLILTTQKDWVKIRTDQLGGRPLWSLRVALEITQGRSDLESALLNVIGETSRESSQTQSQLDPVSSPTSGKDAYDYSATSPV